MSRVRWMGLGLFVLGVLCVLIGRAIGPLHEGEIVTNNVHNFGKAAGLILSYFAGFIFIILGARRVITAS